jgi:hypothetical protein
VPGFGGVGQLREWPDLIGEIDPYRDDVSVRGGTFEDPTGRSGLPVGRSAAEEQLMRQAAERIWVNKQIEQKRQGAREAAAPQKAPPKGEVLRVVSPEMEVKAEGRAPGKRPRLPNPLAAWTQEEIEKRYAPRSDRRPTEKVVRRQWVAPETVVAPTAESRAEAALAAHLQARKAGERMPGTNPAEHSWLAAAIGDLSDPGAVQIVDLIAEDKARRQRIFDALMGRPSSRRQVQVPSLGSEQMAAELAALAVTGPTYEAQLKERQNVQRLLETGLDPAQVRDAQYGYDRQGERTLQMSLDGPVDTIRLGEGPITPGNLWPQDPSLTPEDRPASSGWGQLGGVQVPVRTQRGDVVMRVVDPGAETGLYVQDYDYGPDGYGHAKANVPVVGDAARAIQVEAATRLIGERGLSLAERDGRFVPAEDVRGKAIADLLEIAGGQGGLNKPRPVLMGTLSSSDGTGRQVVEPIYLPAVEDAPVTIERTLPGTPIPLGPRELGPVQVVDPTGSSHVAREIAFRRKTPYPTDYDSQRPRLQELLAEQGLATVRGIGPVPTKEGEGDTLSLHRMRAMTGNPGVRLFDERTGASLGAGGGEAVLNSLRSRPAPVRAEWDLPGGGTGRTWVTPNPFVPGNTGQRGPVQYAMGAPSDIAGPVATLDNTRLRRWSESKFEREARSVEQAGVGRAMAALRTELAERIQSQPRNPWSASQILGQLSRGTGSKETAVLSQEEVNAMVSAGLNTQGTPGSNLREAGRMPDREARMLGAVLGRISRGRAGADVVPLAPVQRTAVYSPLGRR